MSKCEDQVDGPICLPLPGLSQTHSIIGSRTKQSHCDLITCLNGGNLISRSSWAKIQVNVTTTRISLRAAVHRGSWVSSNSSFNESFYLGNIRKYEWTYWNYCMALRPFSRYTQSNAAEHIVHIRRVWSYFSVGRNTIFLEIFKKLASHNLQECTVKLRFASAIKQ